MKTWCLVLVALGLGVSASAQDASLPTEDASSAPHDGAHAPAVASPAGEIDEIIVPGRAPANVRVEIERLEAAVYDRFNALNSNDEFDIHCLKQPQTGSNIPQRTCAPNFVIQAESREARKMLVDGRSSDANNYNRAEHNLRMEKKSRELTEELQRVARQDEQLLRDLARLAALRQVEPSDSEPTAQP